MSHDDIRAALEAAAPRPWDCYRPHPNYGTYMVERVAPEGHLSGDCVAVCEDVDADANAHLIANAPTWLAELLAEVDEAQAEAMDVGHDYDRRGERLWRLAALAGWTPGNEADNDATAEFYVRERLAEVDRLSHWKAEALPVIDGLQELGAELGIRLGGRITGPDALAAVKALTARAKAAEQTIREVSRLAMLDRKCPACSGYDAILGALGGGAS